MMVSGGTVGCVFTLPLIGTGLRSNLVDKLTGTTTQLREVSIQYGLI